MDDDKKPNPSNPSPIIYVNPNKKYGLIFNNKSAAANKPKPMDSAAARQKPAVKPCIFGDDDDLEDDESDAKSGSKKPASYQVNTGSNLLKKQTQIEIEKALKEDPTAFEYDEVYDKLEEQKNKVDPKAAAKEKSNEPKYIAGIMKAAAKRQMEFEKLQDRKVQKDREAEGDLWADKEVFVTTAYKKKLEERERLAEEERRQEQIEALLDVRKQKDMSGFYYSMLKLRTGEMVIEEEGEKQRREAKEKEDAVKFKEKSAAKQKTYRTAAREEEEEEEKEEEKEKGTKEDEVVEKTEEDVKPVEIKEEKVESVEKPSQANQEETKPKEEDKSKEKIKKEENKENVIEEKKLSKEEQQKLRLEKMFKKRTVGEVFDHELAEYFLRKNQSLSLKNFVEKE